MKILESIFVHVPVNEVIKHIDSTNPHRGTSRDAWAGIGSSFNLARWYKGKLHISELPNVFPASRRGVKRYAKFGKNFPAIVVIVNNGTIEVIDGVHRVAAARIIGLDIIDAYVGLI